MSPTAQCHVIRTTPRGRGAVATLFLVGRDAFAVLEPCLVLTQRDQRNTAQDHSHCENNAPVFAYFQLADAREEIVLDVRRCDMITLHCHGGNAVVNAVETTLIERGAVRRAWQDWLLETPELEFCPHHKPLDMVQREALQLLPYAETELTAKLLLAQYHGALSRRIGQMMSLREGASSGTSSDSALQEAASILDSLQQSYNSGKHLTTPFRVGLIGPVNAGKSSLMNALLGFNRSITSQVAGTTRDAVSAKTVIAGWPVMLIDTAGVRETSNPIEQEGIARMQTVMADSDLLLLVTDAAAQQTDHLAEIIGLPKNVPVIHVANKIDLVDPQASLRLKNHPDCVPVLALTGLGLEQLCGRMLCKLHKTDDFLDIQTTLSETALVFTERQYSLLCSVRDSANHPPNRRL